MFVYYPNREMDVLDVLGPMPGFAADLSLTMVFDRPEVIGELFG